MNVERGTSLAELTTYRLGGPVDTLVRVGTVDDLLQAATELAADPDRPVLVVGRGSNLLVSDDGFAGTVVHLEGDFEALEIDRDARIVRAGGATALPVLARRSATTGCTGLEFYVGIPGSVGGAVRMNAGGHGRETAAVLAEASVVSLRDGTVRRVPASALDFGYRHSSLTARDVVAAAEFVVAPAPAEECEARISEIVRWRREHQPGGSNAGSVFTNPPGDSAGRLIDACGLKGLRVGGAVVSDKHANFFQADAGATAQDVYDLVAAVQRLVFEQTGVRLVPELRMIGFPPL